MMGVTPANAASYLTVLKLKGFVDCVEDRKGLEGGSRWALTVHALKVLQIFGE